MWSALLLLCTTLLGIHGQDIPGMGGFGGPGATCKSFRCTKDKIPVPKRSLRLTSTGCSMGGGMSMFSVGGDDDRDSEIRPCCDRRHACFGLCGASKKKCDALFKKCTDTTCAGLVDDEAKKACESSASLKTLMAGMSGCKDFDAAQLQACDCVAKDKADKRKTQVLTDFYTKWGGEKKAEVGPKVAKLLEKSKSPSAFAFTLMRLVNKFPQCIKQVVDPQAAYMADLMKNSKKDADSTVDDAHTASPTDGEVGLDEEEEEAVDLDDDTPKEEL